MARGDNLKGFFETVNKDVLNVCRFFHCDNVGEMTVKVSIWHNLDGREICYSVYYEDDNHVCCGQGTGAVSELHIRNQSFPSVAIAERIIDTAISVHPMRGFIPFEMEHNVKCLMNYRSTMQS